MACYSLKLGCEPVLSDSLGNACEQPTPNYPAVKFYGYPEHCRRDVIKGMGGVVAVPGQGCPLRTGCDV